MQHCTGRGKAIVLAARRGVLLGKASKFVRETGCPEPCISTLQLSQCYHLIEEDVVLTSISAALGLELKPVAQSLTQSMPGINICGSEKSHANNLPGGCRELQAVHYLT